LFHVSGRGASIAIRGGRDTGLVAAGAAARRRPLGPAPPDAGGRGILELLAHAIELRCMVRTETAALHGRLLTVASTTTTHRPTRIPKPEHAFRAGAPLAALYARSLQAIVVRMTPAAGHWALQGPHVGE